MVDIHRAKAEAGLARWRQVGDAIAEDIRAGRLEPGSKLPAEVGLAERFGVARQTVRRALQELQGEGVIRSEHGRGTFVTDRLFDYRISARKTFEENLITSSRIPSRRLLRMERRPATNRFADLLAADPGESLLSVELLGFADGIPINIVRVMFPLSRTPGLEDTLSRRSASPPDLSVAAALADIGITAYRRSGFRLEVHRATAEERVLLEIGEPAVVVRTESASIARDGRAVFHSEVAYDANKVTFSIGAEAFSAP